MIRDAGGEAHAFTCDVSDQKAVAFVAAKVRVRGVGEEGVEGRKGWRRGRRGEEKRR